MMSATADLPAGTVVRLENERVRVIEVRQKPGEDIPMHSHPDLVLYLLSGGRDRWTFPDGTTQENTFAPGEVHFFPAMSHSVENIGKTEMHLIAVELK
jgi:quercetin dioxygenase-like cupin family protein